MGRGSSKIGGGGSSGMSTISDLRKGLQNYDFGGAGAYYDVKNGGIDTLSDAVYYLWSSNNFPKSGDIYDFVMQADKIIRKARGK